MSSIVVLLVYTCLLIAGIKFGVTLGHSPPYTHGIPDQTIPSQERSRKGNTDLNAIKHLNDEGMIYMKRKLRKDISAIGDGSHHKHGNGIIAAGRDMLLVDSQNVCPPTCHCDSQGNSLTITSCTKDPGISLDNYIQEHRNITAITITFANLQNVPQSICNLSKLTKLVVNSNPALQDLPWDCLKNLPHLNSITTTNNNLTVLRNGSLYGFPALQSLELRSNIIQEIELDVFNDTDRLPQMLGILDLQDNHLVSLDTWPLKLFSTGHVWDIRLNDNQIRTFTNKCGFSYKFNRTIHWQGSLDISHNNYEHFTDLTKLFNFTSEYAILKLFGNSDTLSLDMRGDQYNCDCVDYRFYVMLKLVKKSAKWTELFCAKPVNLYGDKISNIDLDQFICGVKKKCPNGCQCLNTPDKQNMSIDCQNLEMRQMPSEVPSLPQRNYHYNLYITNNSLQYLPNNSFLNHTNEAIFDRNMITNISDSVLESLLGMNVLSLKYNQLSKLPDNILNITINPDIKIYLEGNPWNCDCHFHPTRKWISKELHHIVDTNALMCSLPKRFNHVNILKVSEKDMICGDPPDIALYTNLGIAGGTLLGSILVFVLPAFIIFKSRIWIYHTLKWHPFDLDECEGEDMDYDVFVSYANEDEDYVETYLLPGLQERGYRICYHRIHFLLGQPITSSIERCINKSKRTLIVFSNNFKISHWCMWELSVALEMNHNNNTHRIMAVLYNDVNVGELDLTTRSFFKKYTYLEKGSGHFWINLQYSLPQNKMGPEGYPYDAIEINDDVRESAGNSHNSNIVSYNEDPSINGNTNDDEPLLIV